ncbi:heterokaryon incompatibility protein-domain-containing protein [Paraphoma chrysanthemicola]|nr:heterokaryon incompatibility protein-domain-containing protein [Paraphoma chrysanthemicola]
MRLIQIDEPRRMLFSPLSLVERVGIDIPPYLILSHTWGEDRDEVTFKDMRKGRAQGKLGYNKIQFCVTRAVEHRLRYFWVDTCCIDKSSSAELSEAINSMHRWYQKATVCVVLLSDISSHEYIPYHDPEVMDQEYEEDDAWMENSTSDIRRARWFTRGWTLQELLAPKVIEFYSQEWDFLGDRQDLVDTIHQATRIDKGALLGAPLSSFGVEERLSWAEGRSTKREEDMAYSLLGLFDVHMPLLYGEGKTKALNRLKKEVAEPMRHTPPEPSMGVVNATSTTQHAVSQNVEMEDVEPQATFVPQKPIDTDYLLSNPVFPNFLHPTITPPQQPASFAAQALDIYQQSKHPPSDAYTQRKANLGWRMLSMSLLPRVNGPGLSTSREDGGEDKSTPATEWRNTALKCVCDENFEEHCFEEFDDVYQLRAHMGMSHGIWL